MGDAIRVRAIFFSAVFYLVLSNLIFAVILHLSIPADIAGTDNVYQWAKTDPSLIRWQEWLGTVLFVLAGYFCTLWSGSVGLRNCLILGVIFIGYGLLGIFLHPEHSTRMQVGKIVSPIPLGLIGGYLRIRIHKRLA